MFYLSSRGPVDIEVVKLLCEKGCDACALSTNNGSALHMCAARTDTTEIVRYLLDNGARDHVTSKKGFTDEKEVRLPLHDAVSIPGNHATVRLLLEASGMSINEVNGEQETALHLALSAGEGNEETVRQSQRRKREREESSQLLSKEFLSADSLDDMNINMADGPSFHLILI